MSELHTHQLLTDASGTETIEPEETIISDETPHEIAEKSFADYNVRADIVESLADAGITHPFPIQAMTLPVALSGHDIIGQAKTGTGKTLGFGIPALQRVIGQDDPGYAKLAVPGAPQALVVVPTRELAVQVANDLQTASRKRNARIATIYGGRAYEPQVEALKQGVEVVVGTPGRLIDLYKQKHLSLKNVKIVVLDEADEMLDLGFLPDVETLIAATPAVRQTLLFSATMPGPVIAMARRYMTQPTHIRAADPEDEGLTKRDIRQLIYRAHSMDKTEVVARILQASGRGRTIIF
ncbi:MAG: DEAD/DEAH box helicase, partial [Pseudarthrobacter sp.]|nr:DEAD/DEAH box helicase [Pseudarthrobacter sp.]